MASNYFWSNNILRIDFMKYTHHTYITHDNRFLVNHFNTCVVWYIDSQLLFWFKKVFGMRKITICLYNWIRIILILKSRKMSQWVQYLNKIISVIVVILINFYTINMWLNVKISNQTLLTKKLIKIQTLNITF